MLLPFPKIQPRLGYGLGLVSYRLAKLVSVIAGKIINRFRTFSYYLGHGPVNRSSFHGVLLIPVITRHVKKE